MKLIEDGAVVDPGWRFGDGPDLSSNTGRLVIPLGTFLENVEDITAEKERLGVRMTPDANLDDLRPHLSALGLIVIEFSSFADGRGFSIAHRLRRTWGYRGRLWASGNLIADQYALALQCGFDAMLVDENVLQRQPIEHWRAALLDAPLPYRRQSAMEQGRNGSSLTSGRTIRDETINRWNARFDGLDTEELLAFVIEEEFAGKVALVSSFGTESAVLLHLVAKIAPRTPVLFLDTGKLFPETLAYQAELTARLELADVRILKPDAAAIGNRDPHGGLWRSDNSACCNLRKVEPLHKALAEFDAWISGRKSYQNELRSPLRLFERSGSHIKINPLANWTRNDLEEYIERHDLPAHPLSARGYPSVGCAPCTTPVCDGEHVRAGRWRGSSKTECGIHLANAMIGRGQQRTG